MSDENKVYVACSCNGMLAADLGNPEPIFSTKEKCQIYVDLFNKEYSHATEPCVVVEVVIDKFYTERYSKSELTHHYAFNQKSKNLEETIGGIKKTHKSNGQSVAEIIFDFD